MPGCLPVFLTFWVALVPDRFGDADADGEGAADGFIASFTPPPPPPPPAARAGVSEGAEASITRTGARLPSLIARLIIRASCFAMRILFRSRVNSAWFKTFRS